MNFIPISRVTTSQSVADQLLALIRQGVLKPGDKLPSERELMERLEVGRSSIREALQSLATLNIIEITPGSGTIVKEPQTADILRTDILAFLIGNTAARELLEAREMIEPASVRLACLRATDEDFVHIEALLLAHEEALAAGSPTFEISARFHLVLAEAAHNQVVGRFMESILELLMQRGRKIEQIPGYMRQELAEHRTIYELVCKRNADSAAEALLQHIVHSATSYDTTDNPS